MLRDRSSEIELLDASLEGNSAAFGTIVEKYQSLVCAITFSATGDLERSEELAQQAFVNVWENLRQLEDLKKFRGWLCSTTRNVIRNFFRTQQRTAIRTQQTFENLIEAKSEMADPAEEAATEEQKVVLRDALERIPNTYREPLVLYYRQEKTIKEVAQQLELSEEAARQRISRARKMLREQVAEILENALAKTKPGKAFTTAVIATISGIAVKTSVTAADGAALSASTTSGIATALSSVTAKIITTAAVIVIGVGAVVAYKQLDKPEAEPLLSRPQNSVQESQEQPEEITKIAAELGNSGIDTTLASLSPTENVEIQKTVDRAPSSTAVITKDAEYKFKAKGVLSGLITDAKTGEPVTDACVSISISRVHDTQTDANGFYYLDKIEQDGNYRIGIKTKEYVGISNYSTMPIINLQKEKQLVKHFKLEKACMIEVRVIDEVNEPIKDAKLIATSLVDDRGKRIGDDLYMQRTDEQGLFLLGGFKPARTKYLITAVHQNEIKVKETDGIREVRMEPDYAPGKLIVILEDPEVIEYGEIVLKQGNTIEGYAEYSDGVPAEGLSVTAYPDWWHSYASPGRYPIDPNGYFKILQALPGLYNLQVSIPTGEGSSIGIGAGQAKLPLENDDLLIVKVPRKSPQSLVSIRGTFTFIGDKKPSYVSVDAYSSEGPQGHASFGHGGKLRDSYVIDRLEPGTYKLKFQGDNLEDTIIENVKAPSEGLEVELVYCEKPTIRGTVVVAQTQEPFAKFRARVRKLTTLHGPGYVQRDQWSEFNNSGGNFELGVVGPGVYQVQVVASGFASTWSERISTDENFPVAIELTPGGTISGKVVDEKGQPITAAKVIPLSKASGTMPRTNKIFVSEEGSVETEDGRFILENLAAGLESLKVIHRDYTFYIAEDIEIIEGKTTEGIEIVLTKGAIAEGYVYDGEGKAQPNVTLYFQNKSGYGGSGDEEAGRYATALTDVNGFYRIEGLPENTCYVRRQNDYQSSGVVRRAIVPTVGKTSRLDFGGTPLVTGQIIIDGQPLARHRILLAGTHSPHFGIFKCFQMTDSQGHFVFRGTPLGRYSIYYEDQAKRNKWTKAETIQNQLTDMDVGVIPKQFNTVTLNIQQPDQQSKWDIKEVYLQEGEHFWGQIVSQVEKPAEQGQPCTIENISPGIYTVVLRREDNTRLRQQIEIFENTSEISINIPKSTCIIFGQFTPDSRPWASIWRRDKNVIVHARKQEDGTFRVENLPTGQYIVGGNKMLDEAAVPEFELLENQHKEINIDTTAWSELQVSSLVVMVLDENGIPVPGADLRLQNDYQTIESTLDSGEGQTFIGKPGEYTLYASYRGYAQIQLDVTLSPREIQSMQSKPNLTFIRLQRER